MSGFLYGFEAKEIQTFVFRSARLKDMAGGSELVNRLCESFLDDALAVFADGSRSTVLSRGAGGARIHFADKDAAHAFFATWPLLVDRFAPGVRVVQSLVPFGTGASEAMDDCREQLRTARNSPVPQLPEIGPVIDRSPLTGSAAVKWRPVPNGNSELVDRDLVRRGHYASDRQSLLCKLAGDEHTDVRMWPFDFDQIASSDGKNAYLAIIHADGNDLGTTIGDLLRGATSAGESDIELFTKFSTAVESSTELAAQEAFRTVLLTDVERRSVAGGDLPFYAARPIVVGGDDLTIVVRADLAFGFLQRFLESFERTSAAELERQGLKGRPGVPSCLTACGGIAFVKKSYPFHRAYGLCESLCAFAKKEAKAKRKPGGVVPSCLAFHRVTTSLSESFDEVREKELTGADKLELHAGPYSVGEHAGVMRRLGDLLDAAALIRPGKIPGGSVRKLVSELYRSRSAAKGGFARMLQVSRDAGAEFRGALEALGGDRTCAIFTDDERVSILPDVHIARSIIKDSEVTDND